MKRFFACSLMLALLLGLLPAAQAASPNPIPVLSQEEIPPTPKGIHHYLLVCIDSWDAQLKDQWVSQKGVWANHTDGLILLTVDEFAHRVMLTSFIRDMLIMRPDGKYGRINNFLDKDGWTYDNEKNEYEGLQALVDTINSHFGLRIEKYIVVDFRQVETIIDAVGGVDINITDREANYLKNYSISRSSTTPEIGGGGTYHFTGHAAVIYMRIRKVHTAEYLHADGKVYYDTQDYGRT
ncbi:MAG: LCP family protein, partial [Clostridia bacterium]|nr:LCP family protein [Clostridia bacterium]